jgi:SRR1
VGIRTGPDERYGGGYLIPAIFRDCIQNLDDNAQQNRMPNDEQDEEKWITVLASDKKRVMRKSGVRRKLPPASTGSPIAQSDDCINDSDILWGGLQDCVNYLVNRTQLLGELLDIVDVAFEVGSTSSDGYGEGEGAAAADDDDDCELRTYGCSQRQIMAFGIGNFSKTATTYYSASLWQLAITVCLKRHLAGKVGASGESDVHDVCVSFYDPCSTKEEQSFLIDRLGFRILATNNKGNFPIGKVTTIFFMPHCPAQLYENVIWSNFEPDHRAVVIGNSLSHLATLPSSSHSKVLPCIQSLLPWLNETSINVCKSDWKGAPGNLHGALNDTYVGYYCRNKSGIGERWPLRPYEALLDDDDPELL